MAVSGRQVDASDELVDALKVPRVMEFHLIKEEESGLSLTGVRWQQGSTGDVIVSAARLFGIQAGNGGEVAGSMTDLAGSKLLTL